MEIISQDLGSNVDINTILKRLHLVTGMTVTLYNVRRYWVSSYPKNNCDYCKALRTNMEYHARCGVNDAEAFELCAKKREMIVYRCYMGLYEIIIPLFDQEDICGYLMLGQAMEDREDVRRSCAERLCEARPDMTFEAAMADVTQAYALSEEKLIAIAHVAQTYAEYIGDKGFLKENMNDLANLVSGYIREHLTEKITNAELCYVFLCDRKKLTREFKEAHGMSIIDYTNNLRLRRARQMLHKNPDLNLNYLATTVGFSYQSYFSTLFYKKYGMSPTDMQKLYKEELKNKEKEEKEGKNNGQIE